MNNLMFNSSDYNGSGPENYERYFVPAIGAPLAADLVKSASLRHGERVLDVACGTGVVTRLAATKVGKGGYVVGLDVNPGMLSVARTATPREAAIDWYETSAEAMPLQDGTFDVVLCQMGLQFVTNKIQALKEIRRLLAPSGRVVLNFPGPTPRLFAALSDSLARHIEPKCAGFVNVVFSMHDGDELRDLLMNAGFEDIEVHQTQRTLRLPEPENFLWQYIHSTPLAAMVRMATDKQCADLTDDVSARWQEFLVDGGLNLELSISTVCGK